MAITHGVPRGPWSRARSQNSSQLHFSLMSISIIIILEMRTNEASFQKLQLVVVNNVFFG